MEKAIKYLEDNSSVNGNDLVTIDLEKLTILIKIVQLETMIEFIVMNYPEELGLLQTFQFELKHLLKVQEKSNIEEDNNDISF
jgi:hypothetical protein